MADLEAVLADVSYLMAMEQSKTASAAKSGKKIVLSDPSVRGIMLKHLEKIGELTFDKIFNQQIGYLLFKEYCDQLSDEPVPQLKFYDAIKEFEKLDMDEERISFAKNIYDTYIMKELLSQSHTFSPESVDHVQELLLQAQRTKSLPADTFKPYIQEICESLRGEVFEKFLSSEKFTRFCQWKNFELNVNLTMNDFGVHRIIGRGGFGEVYGCRKSDTGKMFAMKCLDKKRIKAKGGETLALNERLMLSQVSRGQDGCPFIVCMTYAFQTPEKLCFILDLMNGGDLHYHLTQHNVFSEKEVRFYASEVLLGLDHMHRRYVVYRDLKPANCLLDERGHVRISDLGLACDFSKKKPHAGVGTYGYMAPEVIAKGVAYDSSADWFSFGCMIHKLLKGHSPFRQAAKGEKQDMEKMMQHIELSDNMSSEMRTLLEGLLQREVDKRLGCMGRGAEEIKEHPFFQGTDWQQVYLQKCPPPLIPPRGEVNAADAFDIGSFDDDETKGVKLTEADQEIYKDFNMVVSDRWQAEVCESIFEVVNQETDRIEAKRRHKQANTLSILGSSGEYLEQTTEPMNNGVGLASVSTDCIVEGEVSKLGGPFMQTWQKKHLKLFPNRLELYNKGRDGIIVKGVELISMLDIKEISPEFVKMNKADNCIAITLKNDTKIYLTSQDRIVINQWKEEILNGYHLSHKIISNMNRKALKMYGTDVPCSSPPAHMNNPPLASSHNSPIASNSSGGSTALKSA